MLSPDTALQELTAFSRLATNGTWDVLATFDGSFTVRQAIAVAQALEAIDSPAVRINGVEEGQFYFRAFLPLPQWRDAASRLSQPPEVHFGKKGGVSVTHFLEHARGDRAETYGEPKGLFYCRRRRGVRAQSGRQVANHASFRLSRRKARAALRLPARRYG